MIEASPVAVTAASATDDDAPPPTKKFKGSDMLRAYLVDSSDDDDSTPAADAAESLSVKIAHYDSSKVVHHTMQPLDFWKSAKSQYPLLSTVAFVASTSPENVAKILFLNKKFLTNNENYLSGCYIFCVYAASQ